MYECFLFKQKTGDEMRISDWSSDVCSSDLTVAATLLERDYLRRQVQTLSAEGRLSGWILGALPVGMFIYMLLVRREYVSRLWTEAMGLAMLGGAVVLLAFGAFVISRIVKVEV